MLNFVIYDTIDFSLLHFGPAAIAY